MGDPAGATMKPRRLPPFPPETRTGRLFIYPSGTAIIREFLVNGVLWLSSYTAQTGWSDPWPASLGTVNDNGLLVDSFGTASRVYRSPDAT